MADKYFRGDMDFVFLVGETHQRLKKDKADDRSKKKKNSSNICKLTYKSLERDFTARNIILGNRRDYVIRECVKYYKKEKIYVPKCRRKKTGPKVLLNPGQLAMIIENVRIKYCHFLNSSSTLSAALSEESLRGLVKEVDDKYEEKVAVKNHYSRFYLNVTLKTMILSAILPAVVSPENESTSSASAATTPSSPVIFLGLKTLDKENTQNSPDYSSDEDSASEDGDDEMVVG